MKTSKKHLGLGRTLIAAAVTAAFGTAYAQDDDLAKLTQIESSVGVGASVVSGNQSDRSIFGQYNGMREDRGYLNLDIDYVKRDDATGTWTRVQGRNLGLDSRDLDFTLQKQGDWKFTGDYSELVHREIRTINTNMVGAGTTTPTDLYLPTPGAGTDVNLQMKRTALGLGGEKWINPSLQFQVNFKNEDKDGARLWGRGYDCASYVCLGQVGTATTTTQQRWAVLLLPEPVNSNSKQIDAKLNFHTDKLFVSGGYYGSFYTNSNGNVRFLSVPSSLNNPLGTGTAPLSGAAAGGTSLQGVLQLPMALQPDNQAHQLYVDGNYAFTRTVHSTFKLAYTHATQNDSFAAMGLTGAPAGRSDLGGALDTTLAQFGVTARPMSKLSVLANLRYENREDKTPIDFYNIENAAGNLWTNGHISLKRTAAKLEGTYQLPANTRATVGMDYESIDRGEFESTDFVAGLTGLREKTSETGYRAELRRPISDTFTGAIGYVSSRRDGSSWLKPNAITVLGVTAVDDATIFARTGAFPYMLMDRTRDKVKLSGDWIPTDKLSLQFAVEDGKDKYSAPTQKGLSDTGSQLLSVDGAYIVSEKWKVTGYVSSGLQTIGVAQGNGGYVADLRDRNNAFGVGLIGKPTGLIEVGAKLSVINDVTSYGQSLDPNSTASAATNTNNSNQMATYPLPDVTYRETKLNLYGKYALKKNADVRLDLIHFRAKLNEWAWGYNGVPFTYSDNTTVSINPDQRVTLFAATYIYKFK